jgi:DNA-binding LytR/AlgR family response regulator
MSSSRPTALIADDEPLLRKQLIRLLAQAWPELHVVAQARNGREAVEQFEALRPDICFLDVHMPALSGVEVARFIDRRAHLVFVTAFDQYAVQGFEQGALDYLVKPVELVRLDDTVAPRSRYPTPGHFWSNWKRTFAGKRHWRRYAGSAFRSGRHCAWFRSTRSTSCALTRSTPWLPGAATMARQPRD